MVYTHLTHGTTHIELRDLTAWVLHSTHENNAREVAIEFLSNIGEWNNTYSPIAHLFDTVFLAFKRKALCISFTITSSREKVE